MGPGPAAEMAGSFQNKMAEIGEFRSLVIPRARPGNRKASGGRPLLVAHLVEFGSLRRQELHQLHPGHGTTVDGLCHYIIEREFTEFGEFVPLEKVYDLVPGVVN